MDILTQKAKRQLKKLKAQRNIIHEMAVPISTMNYFVDDDNYYSWCRLSGWSRWQIIERSPEGIKVTKLPMDIEI